MTITHTSRRAVILVVSTVLLAGRIASGQAPDNATIDRTLHERWKVVLPQVASEQRVDISSAAVPPDQKRAVYRKALQRLSDDPAVRKVSAPNLSLVDETTTARDREFVARLKNAALTHTQPKSVNATSANPAAGNLTEKSGFAELLALALDSQNFFNANETAVSLNLNALALFSLADPAVYSELHRYQQHEALRRLGGTVVFGAKIPEKQITGISGLPDANTLFDAFTWDVKCRLIGDKDARARRWYSYTLGRNAVLNQMTVLQNDVPIGDLTLFTAALNDLVGEQLALLKARINRSPQLTFKTSGTHLTKETGNNKYVVGLLYDQGFGAIENITADVLYSMTKDVQLGANTFQVKQIGVNVSFSTKLARDVIVNGRAIDWSNGTTVNVFTNKGALPVDVRNTWKLFTKFDIPITDAATVPVAVVFTNDKNELQKSKYVSGFVGLSYDFSAIGSLFQK
jgi:hypothetical protein